MEENFRDWYMDKVIGYFAENSEDNYELSVEFLKMPLNLAVPGHSKGVTSFREVIHPKTNLDKDTFDKLGG